jgi:hypothetical protein
VVILRSYAHFLYVDLRIVVGIAPKKDIAILTTTTSRKEGASSAKERLSTGPNSLFKGLW